MQDYQFTDRYGVSIEGAPSRERFGELLDTIAGVPADEDWREVSISDSSGWALTVTPEWIQVEDLDGHGGIAVCRHTERDEAMQVAGEFIRAGHVAAQAVMERIGIVEPSRDTAPLDVRLCDLVEDPFGVIEATAGEVIGATGIMLTMPWNEVSDDDIEFRLDTVPITAVGGIEALSIDLVDSRSISRGDAAAVGAAVREAACAAWGTPRRFDSAPDGIHACTILDLWMLNFRMPSVEVWEHEGRYVAMLANTSAGDGEAASNTTLLVISREIAEVVAHDSNPDGDTDGAMPASTFEARLLASSPSATVLPTELRRAWAFMESQGWTTQDAVGGTHLTQHGHDVDHGVVFSDGLSLRGWCDPDAPGAENLLPLAEIDGAGAVAALWTDSDGAQRVVALSSEGTDSLRLADCALDLLRLLAIGYQEISEVTLGERPDADPEDAPPPEVAADLALFREWLQEEYEAEGPDRWEAVPDPEFTQWLRELSERYGIGL